MRVCLNAGAPVDAIQEDKSTPLHFACTQGSVDMVQIMCDMQPEKFKNAMTTEDILKMTPLHRAALFDHLAVVEFLIKMVFLFLILTLKTLITTAADYVLIFFREWKVWYFMWIVCLATIYIKCQVLLSLKNNIKIGWRQLQFCLAL